MDGILKSIENDRKALDIIEELRRTCCAVFLVIESKNLRCTIKTSIHDFSAYGETILEAVTKARAALDRHNQAEFWKTHTVQDLAHAVSICARVGVHALKPVGWFDTASFTTVVKMIGGPFLLPDEATLILAACPHVVRLAQCDTWYLLPGDCKRTV